MRGLIKLKRNICGYAACIRKQKSITAFIKREKKKKYKERKRNENNKGKTARRPQKKCKFTLYGLYK